MERRQEPRFMRGAYLIDSEYAGSPRGPSGPGAAHRPGPQPDHLTIGAFRLAGRVYRRERCAASLQQNCVRDSIKTRLSSIDTRLGLVTDMTDQAVRLDRIESRQNQVEIRLNFGYQPN